MDPEEESMGVMMYSIFGISVVFNTSFLVVSILRRRLHSGHFALMSTLAVVDMVCGGLWSCLAGFTLLAGWNMPHDVCQFQSYMSTFAQMLSAFLLATTAVERMLYMVRPSRHALVFRFKPITFLVLALIGFCGVVASIHLYGSVEIIWLPDARQCGALFTESTQLLDFTFCMDHAIPFYVIATPAIATAFLKFVLVKRSPNGEIVLERNSYVQGDSYSSQLASIQSKFNLTSASSKTKKKKTPSLGKRVYTKWGYSEPEHWDSDVDSGNEDDRSSTSQAPKRIYVLPRTEFILLITSSVCVFVTAMLWLPWVIARFQWNYKPLSNNISEGFAQFSVTCMNLAAVIKLPVYVLINPYFRSAMIKTFCCRRNVN